MKILLVDDDLASIESTARILEFAQHEVVKAHSATEALALLEQASMDMVITDVRMPGLSGIEFFEIALQKQIKTPFLIMTAFGEVQDAVWAMKMGAVDFLQKPFKRQDLLEAVSLVEKRNPAKISDSQIDLLKVGSSKKWNELATLLIQVSKTDAPVLILGESGSGKEMAAREIHSQSARKKAPMITLNCAAIPEALLESELFGYEKGAFTGAASSKMGLIEAAEGGTLFLDEIGDMPLGIQPKLLRVLEEQTYRRLGSNTEKKANVRILAATHRNLNEMVVSGGFRQDLFFRLDVISIHLPTLRERKEDIPDLANFFLDRFSKQYGKNIQGFKGDTLDLILEHDWPGNIRELANAMERAVVLNLDGWISPEDLPASLHRESLVPDSFMSPITIPMGMPLKAVEELLIEKALEWSKGDRARAARMLGVNPRTIYRRLRSKVETST